MVRPWIKGRRLISGCDQWGWPSVDDGQYLHHGNLSSILQAGYPSSEGKVVIGDLQHAQQVRIGEQISIVETDQPAQGSQTVAYVNDLHVLEYGQLSDLKTINPRIYHQMGG